MSSPLSTLTLRYTKRRADLGIIRPGTITNEKHILHGFATFMGNRTPTQIGTSDIERWLISTNHLSAGTRRGRYSVVHHFFDALVDNNTIRRNPCTGTTAPKVPRSRYRSLGANQTAALVAACPDRRARCVIILGLQLGLRRGEIARLETGDIDFDRGTMFVTGKGGHERTVPLTVEALEVIHAYLAELPVRAGALIRGDRFPSRHVSAAWIGRLVADVAYAADVKVRPHDGVSTHALRHTAASDTYQGCRDVLAVRDMLGHVSLATTQVYVRGLDTEHLRAAIEGRRYASPAHAVA